MFRLSLALGFPHPDYLLEQLDSVQISEWMAYANIEPFGSLAEDLRLGQTTAMIGNTHLKKGAKPFKAQDFSLCSSWRKDPGSPQTLSEQKAVMLEFAKSINTRERKKRGKRHGR